MVLRALVKFPHRYVTAVEYRLHRAEEILKRIFTEEQVTHLLDHNVSGDVPVLPPIRLTDDTTIERVTPDPGETLQLYDDQQHDTQVNHPSASSAELGWAESNELGLVHTVASRDSRDGLCRTADHSDREEFEWDEQEKVSASLGSDISGLRTEDDEKGTGKIMDGMATLTIESANHGYLGTASGASHLRMMWMETARGAAWEPSSWSQRQQDILQILRQSETTAATSVIRAQVLVTRTMADAFVNAYFGLYHPTFPAIHEPTFRAQYANTASRPSQGIWRVLANLVAAAGAFASSSDFHDDTDVSLFRTARQNLSMDCLEVGNLTMVQIFGLMAHYLQKRNKPNSGYSYGGLALRLAIGLGLHKELGSRNMTTLAREMRRRIWWSLCVLDVGATITYSRPLTWPQEGVDILLPSNVHEQVSRVF